MSTNIQPGISDLGLESFKQVDTIHSPVLLVDVFCSASDFLLVTVSGSGPRPSNVLVLSQPCLFRLQR